MNSMALHNQGRNEVCLQRFRSVGRVQRCSCKPLCAKQKSKNAGVKVNKRGQVSSRPGPPSSKNVQEAQQEIAQTQGPASVETVRSTAEQQQAPEQQAATAGSGQPKSQSTITETPQVVVDRMFRRVLTFAGLPVFMGMVLFPVFWYLRVVQKIEYPLWIVYITQAAMFGGGLLGITYGILSTSWDPRREGSALGWTELKANLPILLNKDKEQ